ncbi:FHA domain-containing protein [Nocardioides solisilvae]|uniref:FHA domain-containing protein n=1 Tax=Nocardioides solisilvae TaxID=1542435 RepID=UPI000D74D437|nr:FHA domain-containing protein [Nocardioides solisilvae]
MVAETRYAAGSGLLMGFGDHWLLLTDPHDDAVVDDLWEALSSRDPLAQVLAVAERAFSGEVPGLALVDVGPGAGPGGPRELSRGTGTVEAHDGGWALGLGGRPAPDAGRLLLGGVVAADAAVVRPAGRAAAAAPASGGLIDGIPTDILLARGPEGPPPRRPVVRRHDPADSTSRETTEPDPSLVELHAGAITAVPSVIAPAAPPESAALAEPAAPARVDEPVAGPAPEAAAQVGAASPDEPSPTGTSPAPEPAPAGAADHDGSTVFRPDHLVATGMVESVDAVWCPAGHLTPPHQPLCRICRAQVAPQHPQRVPRPVLGGLRLATGEVVPLDRAVVLGRRPQPLPAPGEWPHLVTVPSDHGFVSRMHLHLTVEGWQVVARDLGSRGGTTLKVPGQEPVRMVPERPYALEPGHVLDLADTYEVRYEVGPDAGASGASGDGGGPAS